MYCHNCGNELDAEARFCTNCGTPVKSADDAPTAAEGSAPAEQTAPEAAPAPTAGAAANPAPAPAAAEQTNFKGAVGKSSKKSRSKLSLIMLVVLAVLLVSAIAFAAHYLFTTNGAASNDTTTATEQQEDLTYSVETETIEVSVPVDPYINPGERTDETWEYAVLKASSQSDAVDTINEDIEKTIRETADATNAYSSNGDGIIEELEFCTTLNNIGVTYLDDDIVCFRDFSYITGWGPHGDYCDYGRIYSLETGERINVTSVFDMTDGELAEATKAAVRTYLASNPSDLLSNSETIEGLYLTNETDGNSQYLINSKGLVYKSQDYELGSYAYGAKEIYIAVFDDDDSALIGTEPTEEDWKAY